MKVAEQLETPEEILDLINNVFDTVELATSEQRITERQTAFLPIELQKIDAEGEAFDQPFEALSRDISYGGIGIISRTPLSVERVLLRFKTLDKPPVAVEIQYELEAGPFYLIGGSFDADWSQEDSF